MGTKLYIGNLSYDSNEEELSNLFAQHGEVVSCKIIMDHETGRCKGFAFVEMGTDDEAQKAISSLDGSTFLSRTLKVNEARPQEKRPRKRF